jgi:hypothetical protein
MQLIAVEGVLVLIAVFILVLIVASPFGGGDSAASANPRTTLNAVALPTDDAPAPSQRPKVTGAPAPDDCAPPIDRSFLSANMIVSYYGSPYAETLGILGQHEPVEMTSLLREHARSIDQLNGIRGVQPAFHMVWGTAQPQPGEDGLYVLHVDPETTQEYIDLACDSGFLVFLDLQTAAVTRWTSYGGSNPTSRTATSTWRSTPNSQCGREKCRGRLLATLPRTRSTRYRRN